jgi:hypothetical protein
LFIPDPDPDFLPIPDPGVKKAPDPGSATLLFTPQIQDIPSPFTDSILAEPCVDCRRLQVPLPRDPGGQGVRLRGRNQRPPRPRPPLRQHLCAAPAECARPVCGKESVGALGWQARHGADSGRAGVLLGRGGGREAGPLLATPLRQAACHRGECLKQQAFFRVKGTVSRDE